MTKNKHSCTKPPRQREGKPFPGGKKLRKALAKLAARNSTVPTNGIGNNKMALHKCGSMAK